VSRTTVPPTAPILASTPAPGAAAARRAGAREPRVILRRPLARADWLAAAGTGAAVAAGAGLVAFYLAALWRARDPR
jgi:hypothetical protein